MDVLRRDQLDLLSRQRHEFCLSIFLPTHRGGREIAQDSIRLKNVLKEAEKNLRAVGVAKAKASELLAPLRPMARTRSFWPDQSDGLAIFVALGFLQYFRLPLNFQERMVVGRHFEIKPLLPLFTSGGRFYLLALSQKEAKFFQGTQFGLSELDLPGVPRHIEEITQYDVYEGTYQVHASRGTLAGAKKKEAGVFHGHGAGEDYAKERVLEFFQRVDKGLQRFLNGQHAPLILAAVKELFPIYRQANSYAHLLEQGTEGSFIRSTSEELQRAASSVLEDHFKRAKEQAKAAYQDLAGIGRSTSDLKEALRAVYDGRIQFLFLPDGVERCGVFDPATDELIVHDTPKPGDEDLLNVLAIQTILHSGDFFVVPPNEMPGDSPVAAVLRYASQNKGAAA